MIRLKHPLEKIKYCKRCSLSITRKNVVIGRSSGQYMNSILFIGEAPGVTEDAIGEAFIGDSGRLLDMMLQEASITDFFIANSVLCRPVDQAGRNRPPSTQEILSCLPNLKQIIAYVNPKSICFIGKISERFYKSKIGTPTYQIMHPAAILRIGGKASFAYRENVKKLKNIKDAS